jgi:hypothetical protein
MLLSLPLQKFYFTMITGEIRNKIDAIWDTFWEDLLIIYMEWLLREMNRNIFVYKRKKLFICV